MKISQNNDADKKVEKEYDENKKNTKKINVSNKKREIKAQRAKNLDHNADSIEDIEPSPIQVKEPSEA